MVAYALLAITASSLQPIDYIKLLHSCFVMAGFYCSVFQLLFISGGFPLRSPLQEVKFMLSWVKVW